MKFQLVILSALLVSAIALPVPDEEVSPVVQPLADIKPEVVHNVEEKVAEPIKPELRNIKDGNSLPEPLIKPTEDIKLELPASAPDAELPQTLPELKKEEIIKEDPVKEEIKEEKKPELLAEKQIRSDDVVDETKALPVVVAPVNAAGLSEEPKQVVDEVKPAVQEILPEGKSAAGPADLKKEEILAIEATPEIKAEESKPELLAEEKKEELPARQERTNVEQAEEKSEVNLSAVPEVAPAESVVVPAVKGLLAEEAIPAEEIKPEATAAAASPAAVTDTKLLTEAPEKIEEPLALASEEKPKEELKPAEAKKIDEILPELIQPAEAPAAEIQAAKPEEPEKNSETQILKKQDELKSSEDQKSNESKKADESEESKESDESKEDNKSN